MPADVASSTAVAVDANNATVTVPSGTTDGALLIVVAVKDSDTANTNGTMSAAWTPKTPALGTSNHIKFWYRYAASEPASYTYTGPAGSSSIVFCLRITGGPTSGDPFETAPASAESLAAPSQSPAGSTSLLIAGASEYNGNAGDAWTAASGMTELQDARPAGSYVNACIAKQQLSASGATGTRTFTQVPASGPARTAYSFTVASSGGGSSLTDNPADALGITDSVTDVHDMVRTPADNLGLTDSATSVKTFDRTIADTLGMTDSLLVERSGAGAFSTNDPLGITDSLTVAWDRVVNIADPLGITDPGQAGDIGSNIADSLGITDSVSAVQSGAGVANLADNLGATDSLSVTWARVATLADSMGLSDTSVRGGDVAITLTETLGLTDSVSAVFSTPPPEPEVTPTWIFNPPTRSEWVGSDSLWGRVTRQVGETVLKMTDGSFRQVPFYNPDLDGVDTVYLGGYVHTISDEAADDLTQAGYGAYLTEVTE